VDREGEAPSEPEGRRGSDGASPSRRIGGAETLHQSQVIPPQPPPRPGGRRAGIPDSFLSGRNDPTTRTGETLMKKRIECSIASDRFRRSVEVGGTYLDEDGTREGVELVIFRRSRRAITGIGAELTIAEAKRLVADLGEVIASVESGGMKAEERS
jgi:hypothetical protein